MPIQREGRFLLTHDLGITTSLGIESDQFRACLDAVRDRKLRGVFGSPAFGFRENHLDFLAELPWLEQVWFWDITLTSVDGLYALGGLRHFGVHPRRPPIDFSRFSALETVVWEFQPHDTGLVGVTGVRRLDLWHYNPKSKSFGGLTLPPSLEHLEINWANPSGLDGLPVMPALRHLELHRCRNLASLAGLGVIAPNLETLVVGACGRLMPEQLKHAAPTVRFASMNSQRLIG